jgi:hypothetical protein
MRIKAGKKRQGESWFSDECNVSCSLAYSTLTDMIERIFNGSILLHEMNTIFEKLPEVEKLCTASLHFNWEYNWKDIKILIEHRGKEFTAFKHHKDMLDPFCRELGVHKLRIEG